MARRVENWVQEQVDLTVHGRVRRRRSESKMETRGPDPGGGASLKKNKKTEAVAEQRKMPPRRVKGSGRSDGWKLRSPSTKRKREEPAQVVTQQDHESRADGAGSSNPEQSRDDREEDEPSHAVSFELELFKKFKGKTILVDGSAAQPPSKVWFLKSIDPDKKANFFTFHYANLGFQGKKTVRSAGVRDTSAFLDLKSLTAPVNNQGDLQTVLDLFEALSSCLVYGILPGEYWDSMLHPHAKLVRKVQGMLKTNPGLASIFHHGDFVRAFMKGMSSSAGKNAMKAILLLASMIVFGEDAVFGDKIACYQIGSSDGREFFPVKSAPIDFRSFEEINALSVDVEPSESVSHVCSLTSSNPQSAGLSTEKGVYGDLMLISGVEPNWPHFLFVGEVKEGFGLEGMVQLIKAMLGPMMHQSLVFGLLMNETGACVGSMRQDMDEKQIYFSFDEYGFLEQSSFSFVGFKKMFLHIINALNYSKNNMKQIDRKF